MNNFYELKDGTLINLNEISMIVKDVGGHKTSFHARLTGGHSYRIQRDDLEEIEKILLEGE